MEELKNQIVPESENLISSNVCMLIEHVENARDNVRLKYTGSCGNGGQTVTLFHSSVSEKSIGVSIDIRYTYEGRSMCESRVYRINPGQSISLGCTVPGPTLQRFNFSITGAWLV